MTPAERLLAAADLLEKRAGEAGESPWRFSGETYDADQFGSGWDVDAPNGGYVTRLATKEDATYIATMHPEVGKAVAKVLRDSVQYLASVPGSLTQHTLCADFVDIWRTSIRCPHYDGLLALADLLLAGAS